MSHVVIKSIPIQARIHRNAKQILARDRGHAQKFLAGLHPHGPHAFHARKLHHPDLSGKAQHFAELAVVPPAGDAAAAHNSIDVTDAGAQPIFCQYIGINVWVSDVSYYLLHSACRGWSGNIHPYH